MRMHAGAVIPKDRLRHEGRRFTVPAGHVFDNVLVHHQFVRRVDQRTEADIDFGLTRRRRFMMVLFNGNPNLLHLQDHLSADILLCIMRWDWKVSFLMPNFCAQVMAFLTYVPGASFRVYKVKTAMTGLIVTSLIENVELRFLSPIGGIANLRALEILSRLLRHKPRIAIIGFARNRIDAI